MNALAKTTDQAVIMKAFRNACTLLDLSGSEQAKLLGVNTSTLSRNADKGFSESHKAFEIQKTFIRIYRSLYAIVGGDKAMMKHWFNTHNSALNGAPNQLCMSLAGLFHVSAYLDAMRGKV